MVMAFRSVLHSITALTVLLRGDADYLDDLLITSKAFTIMFTMSFVGLMMIALVALIIAVFTSQFHFAKSQTTYRNTMDTPDYEMVDFMMKRFKMWSGITKQKPVSIQNFLRWL